MTKGNKQSKDSPSLQQPPTNPFFIFRDEVYVKMHIENPQFDRGRLTQHVNDLWVDMDSEQKKKYYDAYKQIQDKFKKDLEEYESKYGKVGDRLVKFNNSPPQVQFRSEKKSKDDPKGKKKKDKKDKNKKQKNGKKNSKKKEESKSESEDSYEEEQEQAQFEDEQSEVQGSESQQGKPAKNKIKSSINKEKADKELKHKKGKLSRLKKPKDISKEDDTRQMWVFDKQMRSSDSEDQ